MMGSLPRPPLGTAVLLVVTVWITLALVSGEIGETNVKDRLGVREIPDIIGPAARAHLKPRTVQAPSGHPLVERTVTRPLKKVVAALPGDRQTVLSRLAEDELSVPESLVVTPSPASPEVRTLRLYHVRTGESLAVTYKRDGRFIPSAMAQLDYFLRDWRTNGFVSMSGKTIDLLWELHRDLGSKQPIRVICGFRSAQTNALLKRLGRHVASRSEHLLGRAIDVQFPDIPLKLLRNSALVQQAGGVGYYPAGNGGFIHLDSGRLRHWPVISRTELAGIFAEHTGYRSNRRAGLGSETASTRQQNGDQAGPIGKPALPGVRRSSRVALDTNSAYASPLVSAKALRVTSRPAPGAVVLKNLSKRGLKSHRRLSSRSVEHGRVGASCCRPGLRKQPGNAGKHFLPPNQGHSSPRSSVEKALTRAYNQAVDATKRTLRILSAIVTKPKGLINVGTKCPVPQRRRTASKLSDVRPRCKVARIGPTVGAFQPRQISKPRAKRPAPAMAGRIPRKR